MEKDAEFLKVQSFLEDILILHGLRRNLALLLFEMFPYLNGQNQIIVNAFMKKELAEKTETSKGTIDNAILKMNEVGLLERIDRGTYTFHPVLFKIRNLLKNDSAKVTITYTAKDRTFDIE
ncbi:replication/maintenance protein RepL [Heyndrickxia sporothermodurans]|uniref:Replication/maintenance protein RepL n=1 Tax=Heyndrickxia sporothermodurans TaxID=46224 RepID=A0AB37HB16_9BACI|nr:replication/maintenance protein RepL [Heyndrickxia sporothermodurans]MBL5782260.1 replication/maintenance protein RepL [Heyndrickxia sporothermodurans]MBL5793621.1 replication/maintenance protein RepL [Heyndrickxia sporothermodurans]MBL5854623.1 replication/maintenance protein RepL [Heyndrickxia sporothermodurans]MBL5866722.1 replication/maintenance protein RepL [Heyndrickxia sporothermodurans]MBL7247474.1 replication/maintenance protein RepL [Heyndrickxia sporothermodurans]